MNSNNFVLLNTHLYICGSYANNSAIYIVYHLQLCSLHEYSCYIAHSTVNNNQSINHHNKYAVECCQNQITFLLVYHFLMLLFTFEVALPFGIAILYTGLYYTITLTLRFIASMICRHWYTYTILNDCKKPDTLNLHTTVHPLSDNQQHTFSDPTIEQK